MIHRLILFTLITIVISLFYSVNNTVALEDPILYSPAAGAYVDGTEVSFSWSPIYNIGCASYLNICSDQFCNNIINDLSGTYGSSLTVPLNYENNGTRYYWYIFRACLDSLANVYTNRSSTSFFTTFDIASSATITSTPASSVIEGHQVMISADGDGAPLNDYLYYFYVATFIDNNYSSSQDLAGPSAISSCTWIAPAYDAHKTYILVAQVGTSSHANFSGGFSWEELVWRPFQVLPSSTPVITTTSLPDAMSEAPYYTAALSVTGGQPPYTWSNINSGQPSSWIFDGINIDPNSGVISGTPNGWNESFPLTIQVKDSRDLVATKYFTFVVHPPLRISPSYLPDAISGTVYNQSLTAGGGKPPYSNWLISSGNLPTGLNLDRNSGIISGIPNSSGYFQFDVEISDSLNSTAYKSYSIYIYPPMWIVTNSLSSGTTGVPYAQNLIASGGYPGSYCWTIYAGSLPPGLTLTSTGAISGTPTAYGSYTFTAQVGSACQNPASTVRQQYTVVVYAPLVINTLSLSSGVVGSTYSQILSATGGNGTFVWSLPTGGLPPGLILNSSTGEISGTPQSAGTYTFTVQVSDSQSPTAATSSRSFTVTVSCPPLLIDTSTLSSGTSGTSYSQTLSATGGMTPYTWSISSGILPAGLSLDATNGIISGITNDVGSFNITIQVADTQNPPATASRSYSFNITNAIMQNSAELSTVVGCEASAYTPTCSTTNVMTGVVAHDQELFNTKGAAFGTAFELFYMSMPDYNGPLGLNWSHTYDIFLTVNSDGSVVLQDGIGSKSFYTKSGSSYVSPPGDFSTLVKNGDNSYTITYRDGQKKNFRSDGKITSLADRFNNSISFTYTGSDLTGITDQTGRITTIIYDQTTTPHRISSITDPNGKVYDFAYQGSTLYRVTNPAADPAVSPERGYWEYVYDPPGSGYLKSKRDPKGNTSQYTYLGDHRMEKAIDPEGQTRSIVYPSTTGTLRTTTLTEKDNGSWGYTYDTQAGVIKEKTDPNNKVIKYTYYVNGNLKSKTEPKDGTVRLTTFYTFDSYGNVLTQTDPVDLSSYSPAIDPETVADPTTLATLLPPIKPAIRYSYDNANYDRITSISDERVTPFLTTTYVYTTESGGEVVAATATPGNYVTVIKKNPNGTVKDIIDANGKHTTLTYFPDTTANRSAGIFGLLQSVTDPAGITTTITSYDKNGNPLEVSAKDTAGTVRLTTSQQHDALNRLKQLTKTTATLPAIINQYGYDNVGNMTSFVDAEQVGTTRKTTYEYNYNHQVKKITDAKLNDTVFKYSGSEKNGVDKLVGVYDAGVTKNTPLDSQPHTAFNYDKLGRLEYETDQVGKKMHYTYYDNGQLHEKYDATNSIPGTLLVTYLYNNRGQIAHKTFSDGTFEDYTYKPDGKLETATNQYISYTYAYYDNGRLQTVTDTTNNRVISYDQYDNLGQRKQVTIMKGAGADERIISYEYDSANRPWTITSGAGQFTYAYDNLGRRDTLTYPNSTTADWDFDDLNRLTSITHKVTGGASFAAFNYTDFDKAGNRKSVSGSKNETYQYDELYRLYTITSTKPETLNYDAVGNRQNGPGPGDTVYDHNNANQMTLGRKLSYDYDNRGNQTTKTVPGATDKTWVQTWDYQDRLVKVEKTKGTEKRTITFKYDPFGRRIEKKFVQTKNGVTQTETTNYVYDNEDIVLEIFTTDTMTEKTFYIHGPAIDEPLALERNGQYFYFHQDGLGSVTSITNAAHAVVQTYEYDSYGMVTPSPNFRNSYTWTGREWDPETGTYYFRNRTYDPMDGRFIQKDPIGMAGGINVYAYVDGNVENMTDPYGLDYHHLVPQSIWKNLNLSGEVKTLLNKAVVEAGDHNFRSPHREYNQVVRELWNDFFKEVNPEKITKGQAELFVESVKLNPKSGKLLDEIVVKGGSSCMSKLAKGLKGGSKIFPIIGAVIYVVDELLNVDQLH